MSQIFSDAFQGPLNTAGQATLSIINSLPLDEDNDAVYRQYNQDFLYTTYKISNNYSKNRGIYMGGITSPTLFQGASVAFVQINAPTLLWICEWRAECAGAVPEVPNPTGKGNWILLQDSWSAGPIVIGPDGVTPIYTMFGKYVYGNTNPAVITSNEVKFPLPPWLDAANVERVVPVNKLKDGISTPLAGDSGGNGPSGVIIEASNSSSSEGATFFGGGIIGG